MASIAYPGLDSPRALRYACTKGVLADRVLIECLPQAGTIAANGNVVYGDGTTSVTLYNCRVDWASVRYNTNGQVVSIQLWDRRWWWRYGEITGVYNFTMPDGTVDPAGQKTMQELATLLLDAMGEAGYDVSVLPTDVYPYVDWDADNPADELQKLLNQFGYEPVWSPYTDVVTVCINNTGTALPTGTDVVSISYAATAGERPTAVRMKGSRLCYQSKLKLVPVGLDTDGTIKKLDDLSYKPATGWVWIEGDRFDDVADVSGEQARQYALMSVFKWFIVESQADGTQDVPGYTDNPVPNIDAILPLDPKLNDTYTDAYGNQRYRDAYIQGVFLAESNPGTIDNTEEDAYVEEPWELKRELGLVVFKTEMVKYADDGLAMAPADLYLTCTYAVTNADNHQKVRYEREQSLSGAPASSGPYIVTREELVNRFTARYSNPSDATEVTSTDDNTTDIDALADGLIGQIVQDFGDNSAFVIAYRNIQNFALDGARHQISWVVSMRDGKQGGGSSTTASWNMEFEPGVMRSVDRRRVIRDRHRSRHNGRPARRRFEVHGKRE